MRLEDSLTRDREVVQAFTTPGVLQASRAASFAARVSPVEAVEGFEPYGDDTGAEYWLDVAPGSVRLATVGATPVMRTYDDTNRRDVITSWSRKSRAEMVKRLSTLDFAPMFTSGIPMMVTLTYPRAWEVWAGDSRTAHRHLDNLRRAWLDKFGRQIRGVWKLEFQRRGAPHFHLFVTRPTSYTASEFRQWISETWTRICAPSDADPLDVQAHRAAGVRCDVRAGVSMKDAKRIVVYFTKHSSKASGDKEYQHIVPDLWLESGGAGRFWGYWDLEPVVASVQLAPAQWFRARRLLRRAYLSHYRSSRARVLSRATHSGGFVLANDGALLAAGISAALLLDPDPVPLPSLAERLERLPGLRHGRQLYLSRAQ